MVRADEPATERDGSPRRRIPGLAGDRVVRDGLVREVSAALDEAPGLVTLVGVGGAGKTFTAAAVARARTGEAGVAWVDLQRARNLADLERELAWALGLGRSSSSAALEAELMQHEALLLVLDNLEQLPRDVADRLEDWLDAAPTLRVLGTSRRRLGVAGERLFELTPLPVPREDEVLGSEMWALMGSWAPPGALSEVSAPVAKALLDELEGLPLAIRLAAGRLEVFDAGSLAERLARGRGLLADPETPELRQGSLANAFSWSFDRLGAEAQAALCALSVFRGPFRLEDAEAILDSPHAVDLVQRLRARHLLSREDDEAGGVRFRMLEAIRTFAGEALRGEARRTALQRHAQWCLAPNEAAHPPPVVDWDEFYRRVPELVGVVDRGVRESLDVGLLLRCAETASFALVRQGRPQDSRDMADRVLKLVPDGDAHLWLHAVLLLRRGEARRLGGDLEGALRDLERGSELAAISGDALVEVFALEHLANAAVDLRDLPTAQRRYERLLAHPSSHLADAAVVRARASLASVRAELAGMPGPDDPLHHELVSATQEAARQAEELDQITQLEVLKALGWLMLELDYFDEARDAYRRAHDVAMQIGDRRAAGHISGNLGIIAGATGDLDEAVRLYDEAVLRYRQAGNQRMASTYLGFRGRALAGAGRLDEARQALTDSLVPEEPRKTRFTEGFRVALALVDARRGHLDIAGLPEEPAHGGWAVPIVHEGFAALRAGDRLQAATALDGLRARIDAVEFGGRELLTAFADALDVAVSAWGFSPHGEWFEPPRQPRVSLEHRPTLGRVLAHLVVQRRDAPGTPSDVAALFAAGWPGEQATPSSAANRVRVALSNLRKAGLGPVLDREEAGWLLSVEAPVSWDRPA